MPVSIFNHVARNHSSCCHLRHLCVRFCPGKSALFVRILPAGVGCGSMVCRHMARFADGYDRGRLPICAAGPDARGLAVEARCHACCPQGLFWPAGHSGGACCGARHLPVWLLGLPS